jgi:hypothetical protein
LIAGIPALWLAAILAQGKVLDRIVATVDDQVITLQDVLEEVRLAALLDGLSPEFTPESKRRAAERHGGESAVEPGHGTYPVPASFR